MNEFLKKLIGKCFLYTLLALCILVFFYIVIPFIPVYNGYEWVKRPDWFFAESMLRISVVVIAFTCLTFIIRQEY